MQDAGGARMYRITLNIERLVEGPYLGTSPELPGLVVQGSSPEEVLANAPAIARDLIEVMVETGEPFPRSLEEVVLPGSVPLLVPA
ncbi:MAG: type II toxin-antitoxin system HicB family antitoxin [Acidobacteriota bacterium]